MVVRKYQEKSVTYRLQQLSSKENIIETTVKYKNKRHLKSRF